jgi:hypothetical protein
MAIQVSPAKSVFLSTPRLKEMFRAIGVALGVTTIGLFWLLAPLITSTHDAIYHWDGSWFQLFVIPMLDFCIFWLLLALVLFFASGRLRIAIWCGIIALTPWIEANNWSYLSHKYIPYWLSALVLALGIFAFPFLLALWRSKFEQKFKQIEEFATAAFIFSAFCGILILSRYAWIGWEARWLNVKPPLHDAAYDRPAQAGRPRVIWILFDELSYQQVYGHRFPGLQLPAFDALASEAAVFTNTVPAGSMTEIVLPSLLTGDPVDEIRPSPNGRQLSIRSASTRPWQRFDEHDTVFQDALNLNYRTAVAGWYNPYCRILPDVLDHCFWSFDSSAENTMAPQATWQSNLMQPWIHFFRDRLGYRVASLFLHVSRQNDIDGQQHISDYVALAQAADRILEDKSSGFALIHMPIPHPNGIYNRETDQFAVRHSDYLDNVALSDKFLRHVRSKLEQSGQWDASTVVVMGDHSWRTTYMWRDAPEWTKEEKIASQGGQFDDRPAYIVKLPEQHTGTRIDEPFSALNTRQLFDALLAQKIRTKEELSAWAIGRGRSSVVVEASALKRGH